MGTLFSTLPSNPVDVYRYIRNFIERSQMTEQQVIKKFEVLCTKYSEDYLLEIVSK
jgi:hypothetical protein